jgi:hypothetical protein
MNNFVRNLIPIFTALSKKGGYVLVVYVVYSVMPCIISARECPIGMKFWPIIFQS